MLQTAMTSLSKTVRTAGAFCTCVLLAGCSSSESAKNPTSSAASSTAASTTAAAASGGSDKLNACALVPQSMLKHFLDITVPAGEEDDSTDDTFDGPTCDYTTTVRTDKVLGADVQVSNDPDTYLPDATYQGFKDLTRITAPGITRGLVVAGTVGSTVLVVNKGVGVSISIDYDPMSRKANFVSLSSRACLPSLHALAEATFQTDQSMGELAKPGLILVARLSPISITTEALMRIRFIRSGMAHAIASHVPTPQQFTRETIPALREASAAERGGIGTGESR